MIRAKELYFSYSGAAPFVISDMNLEISKGEYVSVVGGNGSGMNLLQAKSERSNLRSSRWFPFVSGVGARVVV
jgi:ABC-type transport system involved in cytochrome bd biosynthesis fused ATPase/permease subunit